MTTLLPTPVDPITVEPAVYNRIHRAVCLDMARTMTKMGNDQLELCAHYLSLGNQSHVGFIRDSYYTVAYSRGIDATTFFKRAHEYKIMATRERVIL